LYCVSFQSILLLSILAVQSKEQTKITSIVAHS